MHLEYFALGRPPFPPTPDIDFLLDRAGYRDVLNLLTIALRNHEGFMIVIGAPGAGKTSLCRNLLATLTDQFEVAYVANPHSTAKRLVSTIALELGFHLKRRHDRVRAFSKSLLEHRARGGKPILVCVDGAQAAPLKALERMRLLTDREFEGRKLLQVILFATPELEERLAKRAARHLRQRINLSCRLPPLSRCLTEAYVEHCLRAAGFQGERLFTASALKLLHRVSGGVPRLINKLAEDALVRVYHRGEDLIRPQHIVSGHVAAPELVVLADDPDPPPDDVLILHPPRAGLSRFQGAGRKKNLHLPGKDSP